MSTRRESGKYESSLSMGPPAPSTQRQPSTASQTSLTLPPIRSLDLQQSANAHPSTTDGANGSTRRHEGQVQWSRNNRQWPEDQQTLQKSTLAPAYPAYGRVETQVYHQFPQQQPPVYADAAKLQRVPDETAYRVHHHDPPPLQTNSSRASSIASSGRVHSEADQTMAAYPRSTPDVTFHTPPTAHTHPGGGALYVSPGSGVPYLAQHQSFHPTATHNSRGNHMQQLTPSYLGRTATTRSPSYAIAQDQHQHPRSTPVLGYSGPVPHHGTPNDEFNSYSPPVSRSYGQPASPSTMYSGPPPPYPRQHHPPSPRNQIRSDISEQHHTQPTEHFDTRFQPDSARDAWVREQTQARVVSHSPSTPQRPKDILRRPSQGDESQVQPGRATPISEFGTSITQAAEHCAALASFARHYATLQPGEGESSGRAIRPPAAELAMMVQRATIIVQLLDGLRRKRQAEEDAAAAATVSVFPAVEGSTAPRGVKRAWDSDADDMEQIRAAAAAEAPSTEPNRARADSSASSIVEGGDATAQASSDGDPSPEKDMETIKRKRLSLGVEKDTQSTKTKYRKRGARRNPPGECHACHSRETPEWRRGPDGPRTLCNACGLHYAKLVRNAQNNPDDKDPPVIDLEMLRASSRLAAATSGSSTKNTQPSAIEEEDDDSSNDGDSRALDKASAQNVSRFPEVSGPAAMQHRPAQHIWQPPLLSADSSRSDFSSPQNQYPHSSLRTSHPVTRPSIMAM